MGMPASQLTLLGQATAKIEELRVEALAVNVEVLTVTVKFPPPAGHPEAPKAPITFNWDFVAEEWRVDT